MAITAIKKVTTLSDVKKDSFKSEGKEDVTPVAASRSEEKRTASLKGESLVSAMETTLAEKRTENGAYALSSTFNPLLNFFAQSGALRTRSEEDIYNLFMKAFAYNEAYALKALFYTRDIRGGQGERRTFRTILTRLACSHPDAVARNIERIPAHGRFDDLYALVGTPLEDLAFSVIAAQWNSDATAIAAGDYAHVSLLAKWLKSENASSSETKRLAKLTYKKLGLTPREYRTALTAFREVIHIVESTMSSGAWEDIDYSKLPSLAHKKYRAAFARHDSAGYTAYLASLKKGTAKINASTLYPYELIRPYCSNYCFRGVTVDETLEAQWKALPNYLSGDDSFLIMADTSGSMFPNAICSSVGLAIYFADKARGAFANHFITFTDRPRLVELPHAPNSTLLDKVKCVLDGKYCGYSTNLEAAFDAVLSAAVANKIPASDMPRAIVVISDMEIDDATHSYSWYATGKGRKSPTSFTEVMAAKFEAAGYTMPTLVYWNVEARQDTFHATATDSNVRFVSGQSPSIFKALCEDVDSFGPVTLMLKVLDKYEDIN